MIVVAPCLFHSTVTKTLLVWALYEAVRIFQGSVSYHSFKNFKNKSRNFRTFSLIGGNNNRCLRKKLQSSKEKHSPSY